MHMLYHAQGEHCSCTLTVIQSNIRNTGWPVFALHGGGPGGVLFLSLRLQSGHTRTERSEGQSRTERPGTESTSTEGPPTSISP